MSQPTVLASKPSFAQRLFPPKSTQPDRDTDLNTSSMASAPTSDATMSRHLLELPQELIDIIFELAYPDEPGTLIGPSRWDTRERDRHLQDSAGTYVMKEYPGHKVNDFLISKTYFRNAAAAYVGNRSNSPSASLITMPRGRHTRGIMSAYRKSARVDTIWEAADLYGTQQLRRLTITLSANPFRTTTSAKGHPHPWLPGDLQKDICIEEFTPEDFLHSMAVRNLLRLCGLKEFELRHLDYYDSFAKCFGVKNQALAPICEKNVRTLRELITQHIMQDKPEDYGKEGQDPKRVPLYYGSLVSLKDSVLLEHPFLVDLREKMMGMDPFGMGQPPPLGSLKGVDLTRLMTQGLQQPPGTMSGMMNPFELVRPGSPWFGNFSSNPHSRNSDTAPRRSRSGLHSAGLKGTQESEGMSFAPGPSVSCFRNSGREPMATKEELQLNVREIKPMKEKRNRKKEEAEIKALYEQVDEKLKTFMGHKSYQQKKETLQQMLAVLEGVVEGRRQM
jgi:hypothetical protein